MWTTYCHVFEEDFQLTFMNHIRLLIRNQCGSLIIHGLPNLLAFQQNYSCYDGPNESGIFSPLDEPLLTSYPQDFSSILGAKCCGSLHHHIYRLYNFNLVILWNYYCTSAEQENWSFLYISLYTRLGSFVVRWFSFNVYLIEFVMAHAVCIGAPHFRYKMSLHPKSIHR